MEQAFQSAAQTAPLQGAIAGGVATYDYLIDASRQRFDSHRSIQALLRNPLEPVTLELFLIYFSALGVGMTQPVEGWIRRAGARCRELGLEELAAALTAHARHEADHHLLMQSDTRRLVERWNERHATKLEAAALLALAPAPGVIGYHELHEGVISGSAPYGQLAIEYEIEMLSVSYGPALLRRCTDLLGAETLDGLSFLEDHIALDAGHTHFNRLQLNRLLEQSPDFLAGLVAAGSAALDAYAVFLDDCFQRACQGVS